MYYITYYMSASARFCPPPKGSLNTAEVFLSENAFPSVG